MKASLILLVLVFTLHTVDGQGKKDTLRTTLTRSNNLQIIVTSVIVTDQEKAFKFYTEVLGFIKKTEIPLDKYKWLTVVPPEAKDGVELLLEPPQCGGAEIYQKALYDARIPLTIFGVRDVQKMYEKLKKKGVVFIQPPQKIGMLTVAIFDDTCGNLIQIAQK